MSIQNYFDQAQLALAAYGDLLSGALNSAENAAELVSDSVGMTSAQASAFAATWNVVDQYTDPTTGVSAIVFQAVAGGPKYLAIRGTGGLDDIGADIDLAVGLPLGFNLQYIALKTQVATWLADGTLVSGFTVSGHSLGGYLAVGLEADFGTNIGQAYLYNAPGINGLAGGVTAWILGFFGITAPVDSSKIFNIKADAGTSPITGLGAQVAPAVTIHIEDQFFSDVSNPPGSYNHSQRVLTDSLALYAAYARADSTVCVQAITNILKASSNLNGNTLELALDNLRELLLGATVPGTVPEGRESFYTNLYQLTDWLDVRNQGGTPAIKLDALTSYGGTTIASKAQAATPDGLAYRYAVTQLNPFVLTGDASIYASHNASGELDLYDPATGTGVITDQYLKDRAAMLSWKMKFDTGAPDSDDPLTPRADKPYSEEWDSWSISGDWDFIDLATTVGGQPLKLVIDGVDLSTMINHQIVFGSRNADSLMGDTLSDNLYGGAGADTLTGNGGNDYLEGGAGLDTYLINPGDGNDTILDSDGLGVITIGGVEAKGSAGLDPSKWIHAVGTDIWTDAQNSITYTKSAVSGETWLLIHKGDSNVVVKGWADGELGIQLGAGEPPLAPVTSDTIGGTDGQDFLYGSANNDLIFGLSGVDYLSGFDGDDVLEGGVGNDIIAGGSTSDNDTLKGDDGDDLILGDGAVAATSGTDPATLARNNLLTGIQTTIGADGFMSYTYVQPDDISVGQAYAPGGEDILYGGQGNDVIEAGGQNDYVDGGIGADRLYGMGGQDILLGQEGNDILVGDNVNDNFDFGDDILSGGADNDRLWGAGGNDYLEGGTGDDYLEGDGNLDAAHDGADVLVGGDGNDSLVGGGKDDLLFGGTGNDGLLGQAGNDMLYGEAGTDYLDGGEGDDYLDGGEGIDTLLGGVGNDTLVGGAGDTLDGGEGDDTYIIDGQMTVEISDNQGENTLEVSGEFDLSSVELSVGGSGETINMYLDGLLITFTNGSVFTVISQGDIHSLETLVAETITTPVDLTQTSVGGTLYGGSGNDSITGGAGVDTLHGHGGNDSIYGGDNNDILDGGNGFDSLYGGAGNDLLLGGDSADKYIDGVTNFGADLLDGGSGADKMMGGQGRDIYIVDDVDDLVIENSNEGTDHVDSSVTYTLSANVESLVLSGANAINGIGNELDNSLQSVFSSVSNILSGLGGNDVILVGNWDTALGGDGNDVLYGSNGFVAEFIAAPVYLWGEAGDDSLQGAYGDDTLDGGSGDDAVSGGSGHDNITGGPGKNYLFGDHSATILTSDIIGNDVIAGGDDYDFVRAGAGNDSVRGNGGDDDLGGDFGEDTLFGGQGNDTLDGGAGADTLVGGAGDDTYIINYWIGDAVDIVTEELNEGVDTVYAGMTYTLGKNVENLILTGVQTWSSRTYVVGSLGQAVMEIDPNSFDPLAINGTGNALNNMLTGNSAANTLSGGAGVDTMIGGGGNDTYVVADIGDLVAENLNEGTDLVQSSVTYALTANVENLTLTGKNAINGMGNELNNMLIGNKAANILTGGMGDDVYFVDNALDLVVEATNEGIDSVNSSVAFTLGANVENLFLTGKGPVNGTGNTLDNVLVGTGAANVLTGGAGNDRLDGGAGSDKMIGGIGDDTYVVNVSKDAITEKANEGTDTVESSVTLTLVANVENLTLTGTSAVNGTGNALNNVLKGNSAVNSLTGAAGNDTLEGMGGNDILTGGTGNDTYTVGRGYGTDTVVENDATSGNVDVAQFLTGVGADQIWFQQVGNNLETSIIGTTDKLVISDWYLGSDNHVEQFKTTDGAMTLLDSNVQNLVNAMASFAPPAAGQTSLPTDYQASLATVIAANWQ